MADGTLYFLNTLILSSGQVKSVPTLVGPVYNPIFLDVLTVLSIFSEGHNVEIETQPNEFVKLTPKLAIRLMRDYSISNDMIKELLEKAIYVQTKYDNLDTLQKLADEIIKILGIPVTNLDNIGLLGRAIKEIIGTGVFSNFDQVNTAMTNLEKTCTEFTTASIDALAGDSTKNFKDVEDDIAETNTAILNFANEINDTIASIRNGALLDSFEDVETYVKDAVEKVHNQNTDTILDLGGENEVTAAQIVAALADIEVLKDETANLDNLITMTQDDLDALEALYDAFETATKKRLTDLEATSHDQGTDTILAKDTVNEILVADLKAFIDDTLESLSNINTSSEGLDAAIEALKTEIQTKFDSILNSSMIDSFADVEAAIADAIDSTHSQGTDLELAKGTPDNITAKVIKETLASLTTDITEALDKIVAIANGETINSFAAVESAIDGIDIHTQNTDTALGEDTDTPITLAELLDMKDKIAEAVAAGEVIIDDDTIANAMSKFLANTPDNTTITVSGSKLSAISLKNLIASITELNYVTGAKKNIQAQIDAAVADYTAKINALTGGGGFQGYYATYALFNVDVAADSISDGIYIVGTDETRGSKTTLYRYDKIAKTAKYLGTFNIEVRNFTTNPLNLDTETTGELPKNKLSAAFLKEIKDIKDELHEPGSDLYLAYGTLAQVSALEIRNAIDKLSLFTRTSSASLINDAVVTGDLTWSSYKLNLMLSNVLTSDNAYSKGEADAKFAIKSEIHAHVNKENILDALDEDEFGNLTFNDNLVGVNLNLVTKTFNMSLDTATYSDILYMRDFLFNNGLIYPTNISISIKNKSTVAMPFSIYVLQDTETITLLDISLDSNEEQVYNLDLNSNLYIKSKGKLLMTVTVTAYKLADYIENIDVNYHVPGTDTVIAKDTENEMTAKYIKENIRKLSSLDDDFLHNKNTDTILDLGGPNELSAEVIKASITGAVKLNQGSMITLTSSPATINVECNPFNKAVIVPFVVLEDATNSNISQTINTLISTERSEFTSPDLDLIAFDGDMKLMDSISITPKQTTYDGGLLSDVDMSLSVPVARVTSISIGSAPVKTLSKVKQDSAANLYLRFGVGNATIIKDGWSKVVDVDCPNGEYYTTSESGVPLKFNFTGDSISLIANISNNLSTCAIKIDGQEYIYNEYGADGKNYRVFNIEGLSSMYEHYVEIYLIGAGSINVSAIDLNIGSIITAYDETPAQTGGILFYKDGKYYTYADGVYTPKYDALPSSSVFLTEGLADICDVTNVQSYMVRIFTKSIPKKSLTLNFNITIQPAFVHQVSPISVGNVMKNIDFLHVSGTDVGVVFSLNNGVEWKVMVDGLPVTIASDTVANISAAAMTIDDFNAIDWNPYMVDGALNLMIGFTLTTLTSVVSEIVLQYDMSAYLQKIDCTYTLKNGTAEIIITGYNGKKVVITKIE